MTRQSKRIVKSTAMLVMVLGIARRSYSWKMPGAKPAPKSKVDDGPGNEPNSAAETVRRELAIQPERPPSVAALGTACGHYGSFTPQFLSSLSLFAPVHLVARLQTAGNAANPPL